MFDGRNFFHQPIMNDAKTYENIRKITTGQGDYYTTVDRLKLFKKKHYKMIPIDLSKQKALNSDPKAIQQINFGGNLSDNNNITMLMIQEAKEKKLDFYIKC